MTSNHPAPTTHTDTQTPSLLHRTSSYENNGRGSKSRRFPKRVILVRHGESLGNYDETAYCRIPDWQIPLTEKGYTTSLEVGKEILHIVNGQDAPLFFYCSPYKRTKQTLHGIIQSLGDNPIVGVREEPQLTEQQFGNYQASETMKGCKKDRASFGRFYYRFPEGESGLDVYNRVTAFIATLFRDWGKITNVEDMTVIMVTHGLTLRLFLMRWFQYTVDDFEASKNPPNGAIIVLNRIDDYEHGNYFVIEEEGKALCCFHDNPKERIKSCRHSTKELSSLGHRATSSTRTNFTQFSSFRSIDSSYSTVDYKKFNINSTNNSSSRSNNNSDINGNNVNNVEEDNEDESYFSPYNGRPTYRITGTEELSECVNSGFFDSANLELLHPDSPNASFTDILRNIEAPNAASGITDIDTKLERNSIVTTELTEIVRTASSNRVSFQS